MNQPPFSLQFELLDCDFLETIKWLTNFSWQTISSIQQNSIKFLKSRKKMKITQIFHFLLFANIFAISCAKEWNWKIEGIIYCLNSETRKWEGLKGATVEFLEHDTREESEQS